MANKIGSGHRHVQTAHRHVHKAAERVRRAGEVKRGPALDRSEFEPTARQQRLNLSPQLERVSSDAPTFRVGAARQQQPVSQAFRKSGAVSQADFERIRAQRRADGIAPGTPYSAPGSPEWLAAAGAAAKQASSDFVANVRASLSDPNARFGAKDLSKAEVFSAISDLRSKGFTNSNDLYTYLKRDYGLDPREIHPIYQEWMEQNQPEVVAKNKAAREAAQAKVAEGVAEYNRQLGLKPPGSD